MTRALMIKQAESQDLIDQLNDFITKTLAVRNVGSGIILFYVSIESERGYKLDEEGYLTG